MVLDSSTRLTPRACKRRTLRSAVPGRSRTDPGGRHHRGRRIRLLRKNPNGTFIDTGDNEADFVLIATDARTHDGRVSSSGPDSHSGLGPSAAPAFHVHRPAISTSIAPNREVDPEFHAEPPGVPVPRDQQHRRADHVARWRFVNLTNLNGPAYSNPAVADLRPITGVSRSFPATSIGATAAEALAGTAAIQVGEGGGLNSTLRLRAPGGSGSRRERGHQYSVRATPGRDIQVRDSSRGAAMRGPARQKRLPGRGRKPWAEPAGLRGRSLIGQRDGLIQQAASGTTDGGSFTGLDGIDSLSRRAPPVLIGCGIDLAIEGDSEFVDTVRQILPRLYLEGRGRLAGRTSGRSFERMVEPCDIPGAGRIHGGRRLPGPEPRSAWLRHAPSDRHC